MFADLVESLIVTDDAALVEQLRANESEVRRLVAEQAAISREIERRRLFQDDGHRSVKAFLQANLGCAAYQAANLIKVGCLLDTVPGVGDALLEGHIGVAQASELGRLRANPRVGDQLTEASEVVDALLDAAEQLKYKDFKIVTKRWESLADTEGAEQREANNIEHRNANVIDLDGELFMQASGGSALEAAEMQAIFDTFVEHEFRVDCEARTAAYGPNAPAALLARTAQQRRRDALQLIFQSAQKALEAGLQAGPIPTVVNIISSHYDAKMALIEAGLILAPASPASASASASASAEMGAHQPPPLLQRRRETATGTPISNREVVQALIHGRVRSVLADYTGMPVSYGRLRRLFTGPIRAMAKTLGHHCSHPGCEVPADRCQIDHLDEFAAGTGTTSLVNAGPDCSSHNVFKSRAKLTRKRIATDEVLTTRADGTEMRPVGQRSRIQARRDRNASRRLHPEVREALTQAFGHSDEFLEVRAHFADGEYRLVA